MGMVPLLKQPEPRDCGHMIQHRETRQYYAFIGLLELRLMWMSNSLCSASIQEISAIGQHWEVWSEGGVTEIEPA